ncbi:hypothetical protein Pan181_45010 [Aeoliella mucimassa]|uniref:Uncharacterized protein n=2 Tax=Aeoliella mucimassa TaxID=2527972 RepID=A0A518AU58_9BACT|nr:hypothetical protein Pan181_45010 [Aeoliella mucimassa]
MVVLSVLALFMVLGTAFLISSRFAATGSKVSAKLNRTENNPTDLLERAMLQVLRDTNNPNSSIRYHSLLRDVYGSDGFTGRVFVPSNYDPTDPFSPIAKYAAATTGNELGPTSGQLIDIFVFDNPNVNGMLEAGNVISLERNAWGQPVDYSLSTRKDYYAGCIFTMLTGPAAGQSARIVDYEYVGMNQNVRAVVGGILPVYRMRVMMFPRSDGSVMAAGTNRDVEIADLVADAGSLQGHAFMVNGRPHNGTGAGYDRLAARGTARLGAVETLLDNNGSPIDFQQLALMPNFQYHPMGRDQFDPSSGVSLLGHFDGSSGFVPFGNANSGQDLYLTPDGPGGSDESYDAVDYQNAFLAYMPLTPRAMASYLNTTPEDSPILDSATALNVFVNNGSTVRWNHENTVIPSFHRPALMNYWYTRLLNSSWTSGRGTSPSDIASAIAHPYGLDAIREGSTNDTGDDPGLSVDVRDLLVGIKRRISMRPIREDHPSFDGTNPQSNTAFWELTGPWDVDNDNDGIADSIWVDLGDPVKETEDGRLFKPLYAFLVVDLDNRLNMNVHGSADHFAATNFDPMLAVTRNVKGNLAGGDQASLGVATPVWTSNLMPVGMGWGPADISLRSILTSLKKPYRSGYTPSFGDPMTDDYASLLFGRFASDARSDATWGRNGSINQVMVATGMNAADAAQNIKPGMTFDITTSGVTEGNREPQLPFDFLGYPVVDRQRAQNLYVSTGLPALLPYTMPSAFATSPDLRGRYSTAVDYMGQPVYEPVYDGGGTFLQQLLPTLVDDSPYETNTSPEGRRGTTYESAILGSATPINDDALFAPAEMERILRSYDPETGTAPSRLYDIVEAFDPNKYVLTVAANPSTPTAEEMAIAQKLTAINSRQVTTESYEVPVPADVVPSYISELGPDGAPGNAGVDDDQADSDGDGQAIDDVVPFNPSTGLGEIGWCQVDPNDPRFLSGWSDDFASLTGKSVAEARLVDVLWYRIQRYRARKFLVDGATRPYNWKNPLAITILNDITKQLLPPEVLAGYKMDINRPFGDGQDNNGNGVVDEPLEAGEPWYDVNGDGIWTRGEPFIDLDGDGRFYADYNNDGEWNPATESDYVDFDGDGIGEPLVDNLWAAQLESSSGRPANVDHTMGIDVSGRATTPAGGVLRDDAHLARQLYARHLYVMMLILMDEDYLAPYDPYDPSVRAYLRVKAYQLRATGMDANAAQIEAQRRYTCRQVAQWAVNCVDFRDSDSINTPFEYDEVPWDGWGPVNDNGTPADISDDVLIPLDGDATTNENHVQIVEWAADIDGDGNYMGTNGLRVISNPVPTYGTGGNQLQDDLATRNVVWGAERPELLISESFAFHDTRVEDLSTSASKGDNTTTNGQNDQNKPQDDDPDQRLEPRGSLYVEIYNPWSGDAPKPVELYRHGFTQHPQENNNEFIRDFDQNGDNTLDNDDTYHWADVDGDGTPETRIEGVLLNRLSNVGRYDPISGKVQRSPVWRLIVVEEHPGYNSLDTRPAGQDPYEGLDTSLTTRDDQRSHSGDLRSSNAGQPEPLNDFWKAMQAAGNTTDQVPSMDPMNLDWDEMFYISPISQNGTPRVRWPMSQWQQMKTASDNVTADDPQNQSSDFDRQLFSKPYPYIEREFYFTSNNTPFWARTRDPVTGADTNLRRFNPTARTYSDIGYGTQLKQYYSDLRVRIPFNYIRLGRQLGGMPDLVSLPFRFVANNKLQNSRPDVAIAPVMPGRYAVIGSAGTVYDNLETTDDGRLRFVNTIGRRTPNTAGTDVTKTDDLTHKGAIDSTRRFEMHPSGNPYQQQWLVGANGGLFSEGNVETARGGELMYLANSGTGSSTANVTGRVNNTTLEPTANVVAPAVVVPVEDMNISEPAYGYGVRTRELAQLEADSGDTNQQWRPDAAEGEGAFADSSGNSVHFDTPFDVGPEFNNAWEQPRSVRRFRVLHLQRLADPTMPWNPEPGYNAAYTKISPSDPTRPEYSGHDPSLPVNPYLTVDSASVDLTIFNGTSSVKVNAPGNETRFESAERMGISRQSLGATNAAFQQPQRAIWKQDFFMAPENLGGFPSKLRLAMSRARRGTMAEAVREDHLITKNHMDYFFQHSLGMPNQAAGDIYLQPEATTLAEARDPTDLDNTAGLAGAAAGAPRPDSQIASTYPWLNWNNRPFVSESELLQVPAWSNAEMLRKFSTISNRGINAYVEDLSSLDMSSSGLVEDANKLRYDTMVANFGHLLNFTLSSAVPAMVQSDSSGNPVPIGAPNFHRILDYVHTPSRFVGTDTMLDPISFNIASPVRLNVASMLSADDPRDPRARLMAPFNRVPDYREPGKVNLNTIVSQRETVVTQGSSGGGPRRAANTTSTEMWSDVFDGLMHRVRDGDAVVNGNLLAYGHFGPAWRDVVLSRRGYPDPLPVIGTTLTGPDRSELVMNPQFPTFFKNPFRSSDAGDLVPVPNMVDGGVEVSMLRSHPIRPGTDLGWGNAAIDENGNGLFNETREAIPGEGGADSPPVPLFSELCSTPAIDAKRNSAMHTMPLTRLDNLTTNRSGVFAVWVTVGYFEVLPAPNWNEDQDNVQEQFMNQAGGNLDRAQALYKKVYPQGYQLGKELGSDTGDLERHRGFYIIDRTRPVAFKPGEDVNVEKAILLRRRID